MLWNLRSLRKRLGKCGSTCAACANVSVNAAGLARLAQTSRHGAKDHSQRTPRTYNTAAVALAPTKVATISKRSNPPLRSWSDSYKSTPAVPVSIFLIRLSDFLFPIHVKHTHKGVAHGYGHQVGPKVGQVSIVDVVAVYVWPVHGRPEEGDGEQHHKQCDRTEEEGGIINRSMLGQLL